MNLAAGVLADRAAALGVRAATRVADEALTRAETYVGGGKKGKNGRTQAAPKKAKTAPKKAKKTASKSK